MFSSIGWGEIAVLAIAALFMFGPERLPDLAKEAAGGLKRVRGAVTGARGQVHDTLGEDFDGLRDLDLRRYHPKSLIREHLLGDDERPAGTAADDGGRSGRRDRSTPSPFDADAT